AFWDLLESEGSFLISLICARRVRYSNCLAQAVSTVAFVFLGTSMQAKPVLRALATLALASLTSLTALAADAWPSKPITLVVPFPAGGGTDVVARAIGQQLSQSLKLPVVVDNKPGAATAIGAEIVKRAPADGYMLLVTGASTFSINPAIRSNLRYDPIKDLE